MASASVSLEGAPTRRGVRRGHHPWLRRLAAGVLTLFVASVVVFAATQALPGDAARAILGKEATPARVAALRQQLDLDKPVLAQYASWLGGVVHGDFGTSLAEQRSVTDVIRDPLVNSAVLVALVALVAFPLSLLFGCLAAMSRRSAGDQVFNVATLTVSSLPEFVIGTLFVILFATSVFHWFPAVALIPPGESPLGHLDEMVLPVATLALAVMSYLTRVVRAAMVEALESDFAQMARMKGMPERLVVRRHALPNALIPAVQAAALMLVWLMGGIVIIEFLFNFPGLGTTLTGAVSNRDVPVIQAVTLTFAFAIVVFNIGADALTTFLSPRLRTGGR